MPGSRRLALSLFVQPDTTTDLASLGVLLGGFAAGVVTTVVHRLLREESFQRVEHGAGTLPQRERGAELGGVRTDELIVRVVPLTEEHECWIVTRNAEPGISD
jgi:hypothetical protein